MTRAADGWIQVRGLRVVYPQRGAPPRVAVDGVDLDIARGEALGLVGESGCGKSSLARALLRLAPTQGGSVSIGGVDPSALHGQALRRFRRRAQLVLQDAATSLNPRFRVRDLVADPLRAQRIGRSRAIAARVRALLAEVGLPAELAERFPHELSGGQRQRVALARALVLGPEFIILDEPLSALDASARATLLDLLDRLATRRRRTTMWITHDPSVALRMSARIAVMYAGRIVEIGPADEVWRRPRHPYTRLLWSSVPRLDGARVVGEAAIRREGPRAQAGAGGCAFRRRCPLADARCAQEVPRLAPAPQDAAHESACFHAEAVSLEVIADSGPAGGEKSDDQPSRA